MPKVSPSRRALASLVLVACVLAGRPVAVQAQSRPVGDVWEAYLRVLQVRGLATSRSLHVRPLPMTAGLPADSTAHPWRAHLPAIPTRTDGAIQALLAPVRLRVTGNSGVPYGGNDGAVWQGRGLNVALDGGGTLAWGPITLTLRPVLAYAQNQAFDLAPVDRVDASPYAYAWRRIDLPQRFGPDPYVTIDPGQSALAGTFGGATVGISTQNLWWGPGIQNAILLSNNAAGVPHAFVGTSRPVDVGIGKLEAQWIWGRLQESEWYTEEDAGQGRFITGAVVAFSPSVLKGLTVGGARMFLMDVPDEGLGVGDYFAVLQQGTKSTFASPDNPGGDDQRDQILAFQARWVLPESGFEVYAEAARNDHAWNLTDYLLEPEHAQGYTLGLQKVESLSGGRLLAINAELTHLEQSRTIAVRFTPTYYAHHLVIRGYTQRGQILGAALGPAGNGQYLGVDLYGPTGLWGVFARRQVHDNDAFYVQAEGKEDAYWGHDVSLSVGGRSVVFTGGVELELDAVFTRELNRYFDEDVALWNAHAGVTVRWRPR